MFRPKSTSQTSSRSLLHPILELLVNSTELNTEYHAVTGTSQLVRLEKQHLFLDDSNFFLGNHKNPNHQIFHQSSFDDNNATYLSPLTDHDSFKRLSARYFELCGQSRTFCPDCEVCSAHFWLLCAVNLGIHCTAEILWNCRLASFPLQIPDISTEISHELNSILLTDPRRVRHGAKNWIGIPAVELDILLEQLIVDPTLYLSEMSSYLHGLEYKLHTISQIWQALKSRGITRKVLEVHAKEQDEIRRQNFLKMTSIFTAEQRLYVDERYRSIYHLNLEAHFHYDFPENIVPL